MKRDTKEIIRFCVRYCFDKSDISYEEYMMVQKYNKHKIKW